MQRLARLDGVTAQLADLAAIDLPVMEERLGRIEPPPAGLVDLGAAIERADAIVIVSPEYNHGYPGVLKNALDYFLPQFKRTPVSRVRLALSRHRGLLPRAPTARFHTCSALHPLPAQPRGLRGRRIGAIF